MTCIRVWAIVSLSWRCAHHDFRRNEVIAFAGQPFQLFLLLPVHIIVLAFIQGPRGRLQISTWDRQPERARRRHAETQTNIDIDRLSDDKGKRTVVCDFLLFKEAVCNFWSRLLPVKTKSVAGKTMTRQLTPLLRYVTYFTSTWRWR